ncbi:MAG TPA: NUDIX domain-containing protein [Bacteroidales bacterium]|nr:NUDIX domain-containing protein [Bacteroidales bacterium]
MGKQSSGILLYRKAGKDIEVFLVHPGGPFWAKKDIHSWSIPKGEFGENEDPFETALREFREETGSVISGKFISLNPVRQKGGKTVYCYAVEGDLDPSNLESNTFTMEWPPKSGKMAEFPEVDRGEWFPAKAAMNKINESQIGLIKELAERLNIIFK